MHFLPWVCGLTLSEDQFNVLSRSRGWATLVVAFWPQKAKGCCAVTWCQIQAESRSFGPAFPAHTPIRHRRPPSACRHSLLIQIWCGQEDGPHSVIIQWVVLCFTILMPLENSVFVLFLLLLLFYFIYLFLEMWRGTGCSDRQSSMSETHTDTQTSFRKHFYC